MSRFEWLEMPGNKKKKKFENVHSEPENAERFMEQADEKLKKGDFDNALKYYSRALGEDANIEEAWFQQVWILIQFDELKQSEIWANKALEKFPNSVGLLALKGLLRGFLGDFEKALAYLDNSISKKGNHRFCWLARAYVLLLQKPNLNYKAASRCFLKAIESGSKDWWFLLQVAAVYIETGYPSESMELLNKVKKIKSNSPYFHYIMSRTYMELGFPNEAQEKITKALTIYPNFELAHQYSDFIRKNRGVWYTIKKFFQRKI